MAPNYRRQVERALARQIESGASRQTRQIEIDCKALDQAAQATSASDLTISDIADAIESSERRVLEHVGRMFKLVEVRLRDSHEKTRLDRIHRRVTVLEAENRAEAK